jgi:hypothetical protein
MLSVPDEGYSFNASMRLKKTETASSTSFLDIYLKFDKNGSPDSMRKGTTSIFAIINFPHLDSNIPTWE